VTNRYRPGLDEVLEDEVIDASRREDDVGAGRSDLTHALFRDIDLAFSDFFQFIRVFNEHFDSHLHFGLIETEVKDGDLGIVGDALGHRVAGFRAV